MKKKDLISLKTKSKKELEKQVSSKKLELVKVQMAVKIGKEKNLKKAKALRREIAQILTLIREKEILENRQVTGDKQK